MKQKYKHLSVAKLLKIATKNFNAFIRNRDTDSNGYGRCISKNVPLKVPSEEAHAGHYYSADKFPMLRFNEDNVHLQCRSDNFYKEGNPEAYRINLIKKIGLERVEELDRIAALNKRACFKWCRIELIEIIEKYEEKLKEVKKIKQGKQWVKYL